MQTYRDELYHYGVPGMKWGVRKLTDAVGYRAARSIKNKAERRTIEGRIKQHERIAAKGSKNFLYRNTMGDWRRGQAARLKNVKAHRDAKAAYKQNKTAENKQALRNARANRVVRNVGGFMIGGRGGRGAYHRYRDSGNSTARAALKAAGKMAVTGVAVGAASTLGRSLAREMGII